MSERIKSERLNEIVGIRNLIHPEKIRRQLNHFEALGSEVDAVVCQTALFNTSLSDVKFVANSLCEPSEVLDRFLKYDHPFHTSAPLWRKEQFLRIGGFREDLLSLQDYELHIRAALSGIRFHLVDEMLNFYRQHQGPRISSDRPIREMASRENAFSKVCELLKQFGLWDPPHRSVQAENILWTSIHSKVLGAHDQAKRQLEHALTVESDPARVAKMKTAFLLMSVGLKIKNTPGVAMRICSRFGFDLYAREFWLKRIAADYAGIAGPAS